MAVVAWVVVVGWAVIEGAEEEGSLGDTLGAVLVG